MVSSFLLFDYLYLIAHDFPVKLKVVRASNAENNKMIIAITKLT